MPDELIEKLIAAKNFQAALFLLRQLEFALIDITLHTQPLHDNTAQKIAESVHAQVAVIHPPKYNRFINSFSHIFAGGYAAGYYSYLWAEVLARDAFSLFLKQGIFNRELGDKFRETVLAQGGSQDPLLLFHQFSGRNPDNNALLGYYGLSKK